MKLRTQGMLKLAVAVVAVLAAVPTAALAVAGSSGDPDPAETFAGCLGISGTGAGKVVAVAPGSTPRRACTSEEKLVHLGSGDITSIKAAVGGGVTLKGSGYLGSVYDDGGQVEIGLGNNYKLPQNCASGQIPQRNGTSWTCGSLPGGRVVLGYAGGGQGVGNTWSTLGSPLTLPPGNWAITAKANFLTANTGEDQTHAECRLDVTDHPGIDEGTTWIDSMKGRGQVVLTGAVTFTAQSHVAMVCQDSDISDTEWRHLHITAIQSDSMSVVGL